MLGYVVGIGFSLAFCKVTGKLDFILFFSDGSECMMLLRAGQWGMDHTGARKLQPTPPEALVLLSVAAAGG